MRSVLALLAVATWPSHALGQVVLMARSLAQELGAVADTATVEHVRCLYGLTAPDTIYLLRAVEPEVIEATPLTVRRKPCDPGVLAEWHIHLPGVTMTGEIRNNVDPRESCYLSSLDLQSARRPESPWLTIVQVTRDVVCWWDRQQVVALGPLGHAYLGALPAQRRGWRGDP